MSGIDNWSQAERDLYAIGSRALLDDLERQQREWREGVALDTTATNAMLADAAARSRAAQEETRRYLASLAGDDESPHTDVAGAEGASVPDGHRPPQPNPHAAELDRARAIADMSMSEYAARRADLGVRAPESMNRLFG
jgi:hypothetical protein